MKFVVPAILFAVELVIFNVELFIDVVVPSIVIGVGTADASRPLTIKLLPCIYPLLFVICKFPVILILLGARLVELLIFIVGADKVILESVIQSGALLSKVKPALVAGVI